jgi:NAD(P)-dependent dehydrogenase (short-subunit alcohol dehydrogenase family)
MGLLDGKVAIITGAGSGMGRAMAKRFADEGAKVVAVDYAGDSAGACAAEVSEAGGTCIGLAGDISKEADIDAAIKAAVDNYGGVDILCNNAGILDMNGINDPIDWEYWDRVQAINCKAVAVFIKKIVPVMEKRGGGAIVNTASVAGLVGQAGGLSYTVSKHGVVGITRHTAMDLGDKNIRVNAICPGAIVTGMTKDFNEAPEFVQSGAIKRWGQADEIAKVALFLASDLSSYVTGVALPVDGGWTAH